MDKNYGPNEPLTSPTTRVSIKSIVLWDKTKQNKYFPQPYPLYKVLGVGDSWLPREVMVKGLDRKEWRETSGDDASVYVANVAQCVHLYTFVLFYPRLA